MRGSSSEESSSHESSEELGFISEQTNSKHKYVKNISERLQLLSLRATAEAFMGGFIFILLIVVASHRTSSKGEKVARFGPYCEFPCRQLNVPIPRTFIRHRTDEINYVVPETTVKFGNTAGFGPDIVYIDHEMLWNATHKRELHENWQKLYPKSRGYIKASSEPGDNFEYANPAFHLDNFNGMEVHYEGYILSVFHQLHCLVSVTLSSREDQNLMTTQVYLNISLGNLI